MSRAKRAVNTEVKVHRREQSLPFSRLADRITAAAGYQQKGEQKGIGGIGGGLLGGILQGD